MRALASMVRSTDRNLVSQVATQVNTFRRQQVKQAASEVVMAGVPGEPDYKRGVTAAFRNYIPVHKNSGSNVVGMLAYRTNNKAWRDYNPGFFQGLYAPEGEYDAKPYYYTNIQAVMDNPDDPSLIKTGDPEDVVYGTASAANHSQARSFTTNVIQDTDNW
jgi:hypothetical protein